ncbi:hypothetical protein X975_18847, partial [Stegodyphus mimosarum]
MIILHWIKGNSRKLKVFVKNRVEEIRTFSNSEWGNHYSGEENPADLLSRGDNLVALKDKELWWNGPLWIRKDEDHWPQSSTELFDSLEAELEIENSITLFVGTQSETLFDIQKSSRLSNVLRLTAWIQRFIYNVKNSHNKKNGCLTAEEPQLAEQYWIKRIRMEYFPQKYLPLTKGKPLPTNSIIRQFNQILDERRMILIGGRLQYANISHQEAHPVLLPSACHLSDFIIKDCHERVKHGATAETLTDLREKTWILRAKQRIKSIIHKCALCQKFRTKPMTQIPAQLPAERISEAYPFQTTGLDYLGPLYIKDRDTTRKTYVLLFTCAVARTIHLELTLDFGVDTHLDDPNEPEPLTPGHLIGRRLLTLPQATKGIKGIPSSESQLFKIRRYQEDLLNRIWKGWKTSYLLELRSAHQSRSVNRPTELRENTVVLIKDDNAPRLLWRMSIVTELHSGRDGRVRACTVRLSNVTFIRGPVQLLCPLELSVNT